MKRFAALALAAVVSCFTNASWAEGVDSIYPPAVLAEWQFRFEKFMKGAFREEVESVLTPSERGDFSQVRLEFPLFSSGHEPFAFWRDGNLIYFSTASLKMLSDLLVANAWLGTHHLALTTIEDYVLMLSYWNEAAPPPMPRAALGIPDKARDDPATDQVASLFIHDALLFVLTHELGHVLHKDRSGMSVSPSQSQAYEMAADRFALDVLGRTGRLPAGISTFFQIALAYAPRQGGGTGEYASAGPQTHPLTSERLRQAAADIEANAAKYAKDSAPDTIAPFKALSAQIQVYADLAGDPRSLAFQAQRGLTITPQVLAPRRHHEIIAQPLDYGPANGPFSGKLIGAIVISGVPVDVEAELDNVAGHVRGEYGGAGQFGHLDGLVDGDVLSFSWSSGGAKGRGILHRSGKNYEGSTGFGESTTGFAWRLHAADRPT